MDTHPTNPVNTSAPYPHLENPPIVEAVIEINCTPGATTPWNSESVVSVLADLVPANYSESVELGEVAGNRTIQPNLVVSASRTTSGWFGVQASDSSQGLVARFSRSGFLLSKLAPYNSWEMLQFEFLKLWAIHMEVAKPVELQRIGVRFINRIPMQNEQPASAYLKFNPGFPSSLLDLPMMGFLYHTTFDVSESGLIAKVTYSLQRAEESDDRTHALIADIDVMTNTANAVAVTEQHISGNLAAMHLLKNRLFFESVNIGMLRK